MLQDIRLPSVAQSMFPGPQFGLAGIRRLADQESRPLTCTALKPMGLDAASMARLAGEFASGGVDFIKDDHGLADHSFCPFKDRVRACRDAVEEVNVKTGGRTVYIPNLIGSPAEIEEQAVFCGSLNIHAVMISPMVSGLPFTVHLVRNILKVPLICHPALSGALRISQKALFGQIFKWCGADAVIFPHAGGRFKFSLETCRELAAELRDTSMGFKGICPMPAGGMSLDRIPELFKFYGNETMYLIGGSLMEQPHQVTARTREFTEALAEAFNQSPC